MGRTNVSLLLPHITPQVPKVLPSTTKREWANIQLDPKLSAAMGEPPLHSQRQPPNLKSLLVRSELPKPTIPKGNKRCGKPRCQICKHLVTESVVKVSPSFSIHPPNHTCDSSNVLYCITCAKCPEMSYIGEN